MEYILPAFNNNSINIAITSSNAYVPFLSTLINSIRVNKNEKDNYDIVVLSNKISDKNKNVLLKYYSGDNFSIRFFEVSEYIDNQDLYIWGHITKNTYVRLTILDILKNYQKVLYLDSDIVVNDDLSKLFFLNIENYLLAASVDTLMAGWCSGLNDEQLKYNQNELGMNNVFEYFNAGVMLINIIKFNKITSSEKLFKMASSKEYKWVDQDVLNIVANGNVYYIHPKWNFMTHNYNNEEELAEYYAPEKYWRQYLEAKKEPSIIHYAGNVLPCYTPYVEHADIFWKYARNTPFYEILLSELSRSSNSDKICSTPRRLLIWRIVGYVRKNGFMKSLQYTKNILIGKDGFH